MPSFRSSLEDALRALHVEGGGVLVGVSGGADSVALLRALVDVQSKHRLKVVAAHLNHHLRGTEADADAAWVETLCRPLSVPVAIGSADVSRAARDSGRGIEESARDARYRFFRESARQFDCRWVAVAHTADDQAETILHHVLRGTGLAGLCGMPAVRDLDAELRLIRPLLGLRRRSLRDYLSELGQDFREDRTNSDEAFTRNRVRRQLIPQLEREYNPQLVNALCRLGQQAAEIQGALAVSAGDLLERVLESSNPRECQLKWQPLANVPRHLVREVLMQLWRRQNWPRQRMGFDHWDRLAGILLEGGAGDFPDGLHAGRSGRLLTVVAHDLPGR